MDCRGLAKSWEDVVSIRERTRENRDMLAPPPGSKWLEPNRANAVAHTDVLIPALEVLRLTTPMKLPYLTCLQAELTSFYNNCLGSADEKLVYRNAQELKRLLGLVKRKGTKARTNIAELTKDHGAKQHVLDSWLGKVFD